MEARELVGKQLTESDFAIHSRSSGDDLDAKVSRASLDLAHLRAEVDGWQERLGKVRAIMTRYKAQAKAQVSEVLVEMLDDQQPVDDTTVAAVMELGGGVALADEICIGANAASNLLAVHLEQRQKLMGTETPNVKGRIRAARQELERYKDIAAAAEQFLAQNPHPDYDTEQRTRLEISAFTRRQRELMQLESLLVNPREYTPQSEQGHLRHLVINALTAGGK